MAPRHPIVNATPSTKEADNSMKRRDWLKTTGLAGVAGLTGVAGLPRTSAAAGTSPVAALKGREARNLIFFAYDGTGYENLATATYFSERVLGRPLLFSRLLAEGASGGMYVHSLTSVVTDSSAASSAWSTGRKIVNQQVSQFPDGTPLTAILELARDRGKATGLVTSTRITHATPACWIAKTEHRDQDEAIAAQYLDFLPDVLLGGGVGPFTPAVRDDGRDLLTELRTAGYEVVGSREELARAGGSRLFGAFTPGTNHLAYEIDRRFQGEDSPSLAEVTGKALEVLGGKDQGFVLQVEAGRIDHANHENDAGAMIWDWMAADEALRVVVDFVHANPGTLLMVGMDHDTGAGVLYGYGSGYRESTDAFLALNRQRMSLDRFNERMGRNPSSGEIREGCREFLGLTPSADQVERLGQVFRREARFGHPSAHGGVLNSIHAVISGILSGEELDRPNIAYATRNHTAAVVPILVYGDGIPARGLGLVDNTEIFHWMTDAIGARHENPFMSEEEAIRILTALGPSALPPSAHPFDHSRDERA